MTWGHRYKNQRYANRRYLYPYCTLRVSKSLDLWCVFDRLSNFEKRNLRSGHLMWPGGVTFEVTRSKFSSNVSKCSMNSYAKFGGATRRCFSLSAKKNLRGPDNRPPGRVRVKNICWPGDSDATLLLILFFGVHCILLWIYISKYPFSDRNLYFWVQLQLRR